MICMPRPVPGSEGANFPTEWICTDRKSTRLNSSHSSISYAVFCLKKKKIDRRAARLFLEVETQSELPRYARPPQDHSLPGSPLEDAVRPSGPSEREGAASAGVDPSDSARYASRGPVVELRRFRERVEYSLRLCLDEHRELQVRTGHRGVIRPDAVGATFRDGLQVPQAHPPSVLHGHAC